MYKYMNELNADKEYAWYCGEYGILIAKDGRYKDRWFIADNQGLDNISYGKAIDLVNSLHLKEM